MGNRLLVRERDIKTRENFVICYNSLQGYETHRVKKDFPRNTRLAKCGPESQVTTQEKTEKAVDDMIDGSGVRSPCGSTQDNIFSKT